jgi:Flp pilus assembly protein TadD
MKPTMKVALLVLLFGAASPVHAQDGTIVVSCQNADWSVGACRSGNSGGSSSDASFGNLFRNLFGRNRRPAKVVPVDSARSQAWAAFKAGRYAESEQAYRALAARNSGDAALHFYLAFSISNQGRDVEALAELEKSVGLRGLNADQQALAQEWISYLRGRVAKSAYDRAMERSADAIEDGRWADAERALTDAIRSRPTSQAYALIANAIFRQGRYAEAETFCKEALRLERDPAWASWVNHILAASLFNRQLFSEAEKAYRESLRLQPADLNVKLDLGDVLRMQNRPAEAESLYRDILRTQPNNTDARFGLAVSLRKQQRNSESETQYRELIQIEPSAGAYNNLGEILIRQGKYQEAEGLLKKAMQLDPNSKQVAANLQALNSAVASAESSLWSTINRAPAAPVDPGTTRSALPAGQGGGTAIQQLRGANASGQAAGGTSERSSDFSRDVFDRTGNGAPGGDPVPIRGNTGGRPIPASLANNREFIDLQAKQKGNEQEHQELSRQLDSVRRDKDKASGAARNLLDTVEADLKSKLSRNEYDAGILRRQIDDKIQAAPPEPQQREQKPTGNFSVSFDEEPAGRK